MSTTVQDTSVRDDPALWLRRYHPADDGAARLVCFPHAGGSASFFFPVSARFAPGIEVVALQYPGRQDRRGEPCVTDLGLLADRVADQLAGLPPRPTAYFGHSMGAALAFETAWRLRDGAHAPRAVVASGRRGPATTREERIHLRDDDGLVAEMKRLNGTADRALADDEILRMALPAVRGDYHAIENYRCPPDRRIGCELTVLTGADDPLTTPDEAEQWSGHTDAGFRMRVFDGGHFFLTGHIDEVNAEIADALRRACTAVG